MYGVGHKLHCILFDLREFPEDKHVQYMNLHKPKHIPFSFETGNKMQHTFTCTSWFENQSTYRVEDAFMPWSIIDPDELLSIELMWCGFLHHKDFTGNIILSHNVKQDLKWCETVLHQSSFAPRHLIFSQADIFFITVVCDVWRPLIKCMWRLARVVSNYYYYYYLCVHYCVILTYGSHGKIH